MGWIADVIKATRGAESVNFILTEPLRIIGAQEKRIAPATEILTPDECYVELFVEALWLPKARYLESYYHGVVHAYSSLATLGGQRAKFALVSTPAELTAVNPKALPRVFSRTQRALGPVPWRGGDLDLEIGLFSVNSGGLADSVLDIVTSMSATGGVTFMSTAAPFVPFVRKGLQA